MNNNVHRFKSFPHKDSLSPSYSKREFRFCTKEEKIKSTREWRTQTPQHKYEWEATRCTAPQLVAVAQKYGSAQKQNFKFKIPAVSHTCRSLVWNETKTQCDGEPSGTTGAQPVAVTSQTQVGAGWPIWCCKARLEIIKINNPEKPTPKSEGYFPGGSFV